MQIEITLTAERDAGHSARDLGHLLRKHPDRVHRREAAGGVATVFYPEAGEGRATAVLHLDIDPIGLVRGKGGAAGLIDRYVNDRPYVANSFLSTALIRVLGQSFAGTCKERPDLALRALPLKARLPTVAARGGAATIEALFAPLGYAATATPLFEAGGRGLYDLRLTASVRLCHLLNHLYVLVPVLDDAKHYRVGGDEVDKLLAKGEGWLGQHPARELIARRALKHRRALVRGALDRLAEADDDPVGEAGGDEAAGEAGAGTREPEQALERPIRLHDLRLGAVVAALRAKGCASVLDLGCGEGRLIARLLKERWVERVVGVDASTRALERAARRLRLNDAGEALRARVALQQGSLTYGDRRWQGFDAAALVETIEHLEPSRLSSLEASLFGLARPRVVAVTTPNREHNALFEGLPAHALRHPDHRFEWTRAEFEAWSRRVAGEHGYAVAFEPLGPIDECYGPPSQMALFEREGAT